MQRDHLKQIEQAAETELLETRTRAMALIIKEDELAEEIEGDNQKKNTDGSIPVDGATDTDCQKVDEKIFPVSHLNESSEECVSLPSLNLGRENGPSSRKLSLGSPHAIAAALTGRSEGAVERAGPFHRSDARMIRRHSAAANKVRESEARKVEIEEGQGQGQEDRLDQATQRHGESDRGGKTARNVCTFFKPSHLPHKRHCCFNCCFKLPFVTYHRQTNSMCASLHLLLNSTPWLAKTLSIIVASAVRDPCEGGWSCRAF